MDVELDDIDETLVICLELLDEGVPLADWGEDTVGEPEELNDPELEDRVADDDTLDAVPVDLKNPELEDWVADDDRLDAEL